MLYADRPKAHYRRSPLQEVICQLRFPTILRIGHEDPVEFQEQIRSAFPQYAKRLDKAQPKITGLDSGSPRVEQQPPVPNHCFISADNRWKINLTQDFIALSTVQYPGWEAFARQLDRPLAAFIQLYKPAYFQRVGLRYVNFISRERLGLKQVPWRELIAPAYAGILAEPDVQEADVSRCAAELTFRLDSSCQAKIHAGPGMVKSGNPNTPQDPEIKYILDMDLYMGGNVPCTLAAAALETLHGHSARIFEGAITDRLRQALDPA